VKSPARTTSKVMTRRCNSHAVARRGPGWKLTAMLWRPIPPLHYLLGVLGGLALGAAIAGLASLAAVLTP
jgi:hypothetical protein